MTGHLTALLPRPFSFVVLCLGLLSVVGCQRPDETVEEEETEAPTVVTEEEVAELQKKRDELDKLVWADEVLAQQYEEPFVQFWDELRAADDPYSVFEKFSFDELLLGDPSQPTSRDGGILVTVWDQGERKIDAVTWPAFLASMSEAGFRVQQTEWHHARFVPPGDDTPAMSDVSFKIHAVNERLGKRYQLDGVLKVTWQPRQDATQPPTAQTIDARNLTVAESATGTEFTTLFETSLGADMESPPVIVYDLDGDRDEDILLPGINELHRNLGDGTFKKEALHGGRRPGNAFRAAVVADFNGDGHADLMAANKHLHVYFGDRYGRFAKHKTISSASQTFENCMAITAGDIDGDNDLDVFVAQYKFPYQKGQMPTPFYDANDGFPSYLFINQGNGEFREDTVNAGLGGKRHRRTYSASFVDLDGKNGLDLMVVSDFSGIDTYINDGSGKFTDNSDTFLDERLLFGMSHTLGDFNMDGELDMYLVGMGSTTARRLHQLGLGREEFDEHQKMRMPMGYGNRLMLWKDGRYEQAPFNDQVARTGWAWGSTTFDLENDGDQDIYVANGHLSHTSCRDYCTEFWRHDIYEGSSEHNPALHSLFAKRLPRDRGMSWNGYEHNCLLMNEGGQGFFRVEFFNDVAYEWDGRNVISADFDGDGRVDLLTVMRRVGEGAKLVVAKNETKTDNNWIGVRLQAGEGCPVMGAKVVVHAPPRQLPAQVISGDSLLSQHAPVIHFGLGKQESVDRIEIIWPNGETTSITEPEINKYHEAKPDS